MRHLADRTSPSAGPHPSPNDPPSVPAASHVSTARRDEDAAHGRGDRRVRAEAVVTGAVAGVVPQRDHLHPRVPVEHGRDRVVPPGPPGPIPRIGHAARLADHHRLGQVDAETGASLVEPRGEDGERLLEGLPPGRVHGTRPTTGGVVDIPADPVDGVVPGPHRGRSGQARLRPDHDPHPHRVDGTGRPVHLPHVTPGGDEVSARSPPDLGGVVRLVVERHPHGLPTEASARPWAMRKRSNLPEETSVHLSSGPMSMPRCSCRPARTSATSSPVGTVSVARWKRYTTS